MRTLTSVLLLTIAGVAHAQAGPPSNASATWNNKPAGFAPGHTIHLYIDSSSAPPFSAEADAIHAAGASVSAAYTHNHNTFDYTFFDGNQGRPTLGTDSYIITDASFPGVKQGNNDPGAVHFNSATGLDVIDNGVISIDYAKLTTEAATAYTVTHELSHDFFLGDCPAGCGQTSIMSYEIDVNNPPFMDPTAFDIGNSYDYFSGGGIAPIHPKIEQK